MSDPWAVVQLGDPALLARATAILKAGFDIGELPDMFGEGQHALALMSGGRIVFAIEVELPIKADEVEGKLRLLLDGFDMARMSPRSMTRH